MLTQRERIYLYDTTLRDGAQTIGVNYLLSDKLKVVRILDGIGVDYVEAGFPGSNPVDTALFQSRPPLRNAKLTAFGMTRRPGLTVESDGGFRVMLELAGETVCLVAKSSDYHVRVALEISSEENLELIDDSVRAVVASGRQLILNCEHFFDGYKDNRGYPLAVARTAYEAGARWVTLCDTNGGTLPHEIDRIVREVTEVVPGSHLGIHAHNDTEHAVANSFAAIRAGCRKIHGTLNGIGERCGNASLTSIIPTLLLKPEMAEAFEIGTSLPALRNLSELGSAFDRLAGRHSDAQAPYVGRFAFATKTGIHASAIRKDTATYEHIQPELVGNRREVMLAGQSGRANVLTALEKIEDATRLDDAGLSRIVELVKAREARGYFYDTAEASLELLIRSTLREDERSFDIVDWQVVSAPVRPDHKEAGARATLCLKWQSRNAVDRCVGEGSTALAALQSAMEQWLSRCGIDVGHEPFRLVSIQAIELDDEPTIRVVLERRNAVDDVSRTVGVGGDFAAAAIEALADGIRYCLLSRRRHLLAAAG